MAKGNEVIPINWHLSRQLKELGVFTKENKRSKNKIILELNKYARKKVPAQYSHQTSYSYRKKEWLRLKLKMKFPKECLACGRKTNLHKHHVFTLQKGGTNIRANIVILCEECHSETHGYFCDSNYGNRNFVSKIRGIKKVTEYKFEPKIILRKNK